MGQRLVDANALKETIVDVLTDIKHIIGIYDTLFDSVNNTVCKVIDNAPDIDPVNHGVWNAVPNKILIGGHVAKQGIACECSVCHRASGQWNPTMKYCPNCGARMDGDVRE